MQISVISHFTHLQQSDDIFMFRFNPNIHDQVRQYNGREFYKMAFLQNASHIWHFDRLVLIRYTISDSLVKIQYFRHEWS